jgi:CBS domain-containing protein
MADTDADSLRAQLSTHRLWQLLDETAQTLLLQKAQLAQHTAEQLLCPAGALGDQLGWVLQGQVLLRDPDLEQQLTLLPGEVFGWGGTPQPWLRSWQASAASDTRVLWLAPQTVQALCLRQPAWRHFLPSFLAETQATETQPTLAGMASMPVRALVRRAAVSVPADTSIQAAAAAMVSQRVSSLLLLKHDQLHGIVTDRDLRSRVVAHKLDTDQPISRIATLQPVSVQADSTVFEAKLLMTQKGIHHLPVLDGAAVLGLITHTDLLAQFSASAVFLTADIAKQDSLDGLVAISARTRLLQQQLAAAEASAYSTGHMVTAITDALTVRLIQLAHADLGPAPVPYVWVAAGSQARCEQTAKSDQDNCLVLDNAYDPEVHGAYFKTFSKQVCDGLAACGYIHCPGEMMAMTDTWRQPLSAWTRYFEGWIHQPKPKALMLTSVFFDLRSIEGQHSLLAQLRSDVLALTRSNTLFLAHLVSNALQHRPPLGLFGRLALNKDKEHPNTLDLKHDGIVPIVDLARIYALAAGVQVPNTHDRLAQSAQAGEVSEQSAHDLRDALAFLGKLRIAHQARQIQQGQAPDNHLAVSELSHLERDQLKQVFGVVQTLQEVLHKRYGRVSG